MRLAGVPRSALLATLFATLLALPACKGEENAAASADAGVEDAGSKKQVDKKLAAAIAAAESSAARSGPSPSSSAGDGPPESGVFPPGKADALQPATSPPDVKIIQEGSDPKIQLAYKPPAEDEKSSLTVGVRLGPQQALPTIEFELVTRVDKGEKGDKKDKGTGKKDKGKEKDKDAAAELPAGVTPILVKVAAANAAKDQLGSLPPQVAEKLGKLKGSELHFALAPDGTTSEMMIGLGKDADPALGDILKALAESVSLFVAPLPKKPVGVGGLWMVTDRTASFGIAVVRYRAFKVERIEGGAATVSIDVREYAARGELGGEPGQALVIGRFDAQGKGSEALVGVLGRGADMKLDLRALLGRDKQQPGQQMQVTLTAKAR